MSKKTKKINLKIFNPPLQKNARFLIKGNWKNNKRKTSGTMTDDPLAITSKIGLISYLNNDFVKVDLPKDAQPSKNEPVTLTLRLTAASGPWGGDGSVAPHNLVVIDSNDVIHTQCVLRELGHIMNMVPYPGYYKCPPGFGYNDHIKKYTEMGGSGSHCSYKIDSNLSTSKTNVDGKCIMFHQLNYNCELKYCMHCSPFIKAQNLKSLK